MSALFRNFSAMTDIRLFNSSSSSSEVEGDDESEIQEKSIDKPKRDKNEDVEASTSSKKKKTGSTVDLEELLARTYPKDVSKEEKNGGGLRRSIRSRKKSAKSFEPEFVKKWSGDKEIKVAMALLESSSPEGGLNMTEFYQRGKESLNYEVGTSQLYEKMRRMKKRFMVIKSTMEQGNIPEHRIEFRTPQEPALFKIWQRIWNNNAEQVAAGNLNMRVNGEENADQNPNPNGAANPNPGVVEFENPNANPRIKDAQNQSSGSCAAENPRILDSIVIEIGNPNPRVSEEIGNPNPRVREEIENRGPTVSQAGKSNSLVNGALNPSSWESGAENPKNPNPGVIEDPDPRVIRAENPSPRLTVGENPNPNPNPNPDKLEAEQCNGHTGAEHVCGHAIDKGGITRTRSEFKHSNGFANFGASTGFGREIVFEECMGSCISRKIKELVNAANNVENISHPEWHQTYRQHYVDQLKFLNERLELVQEECKLWLNVLEPSNRSQKP